MASKSREINKMSGAGQGHKREKVCCVSDLGTPSLEALPYMLMLTNRRLRGKMEWLEPGHDGESTLEIVDVKGPVMMSST